MYELSFCLFGFWFGVLQNPLMYEFLSFLFFRWKIIELVVVVVLVQGANHAQFKERTNSQRHIICPRAAPPTRKSAPLFALDVAFSYP